MDIDDLAKALHLGAPIPIIEYDDFLFRGRDWQIVLGSGVQGTVEDMLLSPVKVDSAEEEEAARAQMVPVAVKKTMLNQQRKRRLEVFKRELRALSKIPKHPGIVEVLGFGKDQMDDFVFIVLEKCNTGSGWEWVTNYFS